MNEGLKIEDVADTLGAMHIPWIKHFFKRTNIKTSFLTLTSPNITHNYPV